MGAMDNVDPVLVKALAIGGLGTMACFGWIYGFVIMNNIAGALGLSKDDKPDSTKKNL
ncbi:hypothetical protein OC861_004796 [Tilletia horrida]|nr:hypothetical protein OC845_004809 [Tilletia horrida]KAK0563427.1 hypothetical protein OC861_004796 [Tilletia horrida]